MSDEAPCEVTGKPCRWRSDFETHDNGTTSGVDEYFCTDCYRVQDDEDDSHPPNPTTDPA